MASMLSPAPLPARPRVRPRRFTVDGPISIGRCDSCRRDEVVLRPVRDETDPGDVATFDLCRGCAPART